jgi:DNA-binding MarR family transcriptional regulator
VEVIKRLHQCGFISEFDDQADKRSVRVAITEKGRNEILAILPRMNTVSKIVAGK